jgi:hypothetical protein
MKDMENVNKTFATSQKKLFIVNFFNRVLIF